MAKAKRVVKVYSETILQRIMRNREDCARERLVNNVIMTALEKVKETCRQVLELIQKYRIRNLALGAKAQVQNLCHEYYKKKILQRKKTLKIVLQYNIVQKGATVEDIIKEALDTIKTICERLMINLALNDKTRHKPLAKSNEKLIQLCAFAEK